MENDFKLSVTCFGEARSHVRSLATLRVWPCSKGSNMERLCVESRRVRGHTQPSPQPHQQISSGTTWEGASRGLQPHGHVTPTAWEAKIRAIQGPSQLSQPRGIIINVCFKLWKKEEELWFPLSKHYLLHALYFPRSSPLTDPKITIYRWTISFLLYFY